MEIVAKEIVQIYINLQRRGPNGNVHAASVLMGPKNLLSKKNLCQILIYCFNSVLIDQVFLL